MKKPKKLANKLKTNKGITLIALVISVIVLLILAGVSISAITGNESAMEKAKEARTANEAGGELDSIKLAVVSAMAKGTYGMVEGPNLANELTGTVLDATNDATQISTISQNLAGPWEITGKKGIYTVEKNGQVKEKEGAYVSNSPIVFTEDDISAKNITLGVVTGAQIQSVTWPEAPSGAGFIITGIDNTQATVELVGNPSSNEILATGVSVTVTGTVKRGDVTKTFISTCIIKYTEAKATVKSKSNSLNNNTTASNLEDIEWSTLKKFAKAIEDDTDITNSTKEVVVTYGSTDYTLKVGLEKTVYFKNGKNMEPKVVRILGFNHDIVGGTDNANGEKGISFEFKDIIDTRVMNNSNTNENGWETTTLRNELNNETDYLPKLYKTTTANETNLLQGYFKEIKKDYLSVYNGDTTDVNKTNGDKLWLLACSEIWIDGRDTNCAYGYCKQKEGDVYAYYESIAGLSSSAENSALIKNYSGTIKYWWLRSPNYYDNKGFCVVYSNGACSADDAWKSGHISSKNGVAPGFTI